MEAPRRILVFRNGSIGNTIAAIPALKCLRKSFPDAHISVVVDNVGKELLKNASYFDLLICYDRSDADKGLSGFARTLLTLRKERPDTAILLKRFTRNGLLARSSGAHRRFGFITDGKAPFLTDAIPYDESIHVAELNLRLVKFLGANAEVDVAPRLEIPNEATTKARMWLEVRGITNEYVVAHFGGSTSGAHFLPLALRALLINALAHGLPTLLLGNGASEEREANEVAQESPNAILAVGEPLQMTMALIAQASGFIGTNSGPMHIAAATSTPGIALFKQDERFEVERVKWRPLFSGLHVVPVSPDASSEHRVISTSPMADAVTEHAVAIAIPAYKNPDRLRRCLRSIEKVDHNWLADVVIVDDSGDGQVVKALKSEFPTVKWIAHKENLGFTSAANNAVNACGCDWVLLLNDDCELINDPRVGVQRLLANDATFAISLQSIDEHGQKREGAKRLIWKAGIAKILHNPNDQLTLDNGESETSYAVGGHSLYRRSAFSELGGFDPTYHPFYWEDVDLCQRARIAGWKIQFTTHVQILHGSDGAIKSTQSEELIRTATWRNRLLFSRRHGQGVQRMLFPLGVLWHKLYALITRDSAKHRAISEFKKERRSR